MTLTGAVAILLGLLLGSGLWLMLVRLPWMRRPRFSDRIEPQLRSLSTASRLLDNEESLTLFGPIGRLAGALLKDASGWFARFNAGNAALKVRLERAGSPQNPVDFRAEQLIWAGLGLVAATLLVSWVGTSTGLNLGLAILIVLAVTLCGYLARDYLLSVRIKRREDRMLAEFPSLADLMALAVSAGESTTGALERVCAASNGDLSEEFSRILTQTRSGVPLTEALQNFSRRTRIAPLARFTDGLIVAVERGTPLAEVLRAQAHDVRDLSKRDLMEKAGRKEIGMMIPLVFGILPLTVIFAAFPGLQLLQLNL
ncbi:type II secretion system F family protein [Psychromicrobium xiongbiense]|uniref:type II secretion system F family protein n=1 Tax=Psychromicrobium xiongbiense TaxID=3051184 RepID=UPI002554DFCA|nr:type II secretion system F family protein [Psychromicrobium sp. YIM S02556]